MLKEIIPYNSIYYIMSAKFCNSCNRTRQLYDFTDEYKMCNYCRNRQIRYNNENREKVKNRVKQYMENHKEQIAERKKRYNQDNKENLEAYRKEYMKIIYHCPFCNYDVKHYKKPQHEKSKTHQNNVILKELEDLTKHEN